MTYTATAGVAPSFTDDTGDAQTWTTGTAITPLTVPAASGNPTPTYAAIGNLPAGLAFNIGTRVISGTPATLGSGTIRIRATNNQGTADWTVTFTTTAGPVADRLLIADNSSDALWEIDADGGDTEGTRLRALPSGLTTPYGMTVLGDRLLIADSSGDELYEIDPDGGDTEGTRLRALPSGLTTPDAMTALGDRLLIADSSGDELFEIEPDGADTQGTRLRALPTGLSSPYGMAVLSGRLLIADNSGDEIWEIDPDGGDSEGTLLRDLPAGLSTPYAMTVLGGRLLITDSSGDELWEIDPDGADTEGTLLRDLPIGLSSPYAMTVLPGLVAPSFVDDTGDAQTWNVGSVIMPITVPAASGTPTPAYAAVGTLPSGIAFDTGTRIISGTPTAQGSGTITIRATNSEGSADWTVTYATGASLASPSFVDDTGDAQTWNVGSAITPITVDVASGNPTPTYAAVGTLPGGIAFDTGTRIISGTPTAQGSGTITIRATNSEGSADWTVTYATGAPLVAPSFVDDTGDAQTWTQGMAITPITVDVASGNPTPTYAAVGTLPGGIAFDTGTRIISGTPTAQGSGTITIRATNSEGSADWTVTYATGAPLVAPSFVDDTGDFQTWTQGTTITPITVDMASGNPTPTYAAVGTLPGGIAFDPTTRVISGTPSTVAVRETITIRATNSQGTADWTIEFTVQVAVILASPSFVDDTGDAQTWNVGSVIMPITVPAAAGVPTPAYASVGTLPGGIAFDPTARVISGTPTTQGSGTIRVRATNSEGTADWTVTYATGAALAAPSFVNPTGATQAWNIGATITPITVPAAAGNPSPAYAAVGTLPAGIAFDTGTRVLSGTPTAQGSGTITIRATNSQGTADWTVMYATGASLVAPSFVDDTGDAQTWNVGAAITPITVDVAAGNPTPTYAVRGVLPGGIAFDTGTRVLSGTPTAQGSGTITITATNSEGNADWTVTYATGPPLVAPSFVDDTGDFQTWTQGTTITPITAPAAAGVPTPTYAAVGALPGGIAFDPTTRVISGTPTAHGSGTIRVRATNSQGTVDWTVMYRTAPVLVAPSFTNPTGTPQIWSQGQVITPLTVPLASGNPAPAYAAVGTLPTGIAFNTGTRVISGTPTAQGGGTIRIRATNSEGNADWTVTFTTGPPLVTPSFTIPTGAVQSWVQNQAISAVTVPAASGNPNPTYAVQGGLPTGISFDPPDPRYFRYAHGGRQRHDQDPGHELRGQRRLDLRLHDRGGDSWDHRTADPHNTLGGGLGWRWIFLPRRL